MTGISEQAALTMLFIALLHQCPRFHCGFSSCFVLKFNNLAKLHKNLVCVMNEDVLIYLGIAKTFDRENLKTAMATLSSLTGLSHTFVMT